MIFNSNASASTTTTPAPSETTCPHCPAAKYYDYGRQASDFFSRDFPAGVIKFEAKTLPRGVFFRKAAETFSDVSPLIIDACARNSS
jgi:hypothetical protein